MKTAKRLFFVGIFALALMPVGANAAEVFVRFGLPPPRREVAVVRPGPRHVWVPGYCRWSGAHYAWARGYWTVPPRPPAVWVPGYWAPRHGGYVWVGGY